MASAAARLWRATITDHVAMNPSAPRNGPNRILFAAVWTRMVVNAPRVRSRPRWLPQSAGRRAQRCQGLQAGRQPLPHLCVAQLGEQAAGQ